MEKKDLETKLKGEGKRFAPNVLNKVYKSIGLELSSSKNKEVEAKLLEEGKRLVKNDYKTVSEKIVSKKQPTNKLFLFVKNPITISAAATFLVGVLSASIVLPIVLSKALANTDDGDTVAVDNSVTLDLTSASKSYNAKMKYVIDTDGNVDPSKVITLDNSSAYLIDKYNVVPTTRTGSYVNETKYTEFTSNYLMTALNYGYLEKIDYSKTNELVFKITTSSKSSKQFNLIKNELEESIESFIEENKIILEYTIEEVQSDLYELFSEENYDKASLIIDLYDLSTRLFVGTNKTLTEAYFSSDINDWANRFKNYDVQTLERYVYMLTEFNQNVEGVEQRDRFIDEFYQYSSNFLQEIDLFNSYLPVMNAQEEAIKEELSKSGSVQIKTLLNGPFEELVNYLNHAYGERRNEIDRRFKPSFETDVWDIFVEGYHAFQEKQHGQHSHMPVEDFKKKLSEKYSENSLFEKNEETLFNLYIDLQNLLSLRSNAINIVGDNFTELVFEIIDQHKFVNEWDDDLFSHPHDEPPSDDWDDHFFDWWEDRPHDHSDRDHH